MHVNKAAHLFIKWTYIVIVTSSRMSLSLGASGMSRQMCFGMFPGYVNLFIAMII